MDIHCLNLLSPKPCLNLHSWAKVFSLSLPQQCSVTALAPQPRKHFEKPLSSVRKLDRVPPRAQCFGFWEESTSQTLSLIKVKKKHYMISLNSEPALWGMQKRQWGGRHWWIPHEPSATSLWNLGQHKLCCLHTILPRNLCPSTLWHLNSFQWYLMNKLPYNMWGFFFKN